MGQRFHPFGPPRDDAERRLIRLTAACAALIPALVGIVVKIRLDLLGEPTVGWIEGAIGILVIAAAGSVGWIALLLAFRYVRHLVGHGRSARRVVEWAWLAALVGASAGLAPVLYDLLQIAAHAVLVALLAPWTYWWFTLAGGLAGAVVGAALGWLSRGRESLRAGAA